MDWVVKLGQGASEQNFANIQATFTANMHFEKLLLYLKDLGVLTSYYFKA